MMVDMQSTDGRIHRYLQEKDCLILNFVSTNTREGRVLHKLFERLQSIESDLDLQQTGKIFNVLGDSARPLRKWCQFDSLRRSRRTIRWNDFSRLRALKPDPWASETRSPGPKKEEWRRHDTTLSEV